MIKWFLIGSIAYHLFFIFICCYHEWMLCEKEEEKKKRVEEDFANVLNVKLNYPVKFQESDGLLCFCLEK